MFKLLAVLAGLGLATVFGASDARACFFKKKCKSQQTQTMAAPSPDCCGGGHQSYSQHQGSPQMYGQPSMQYYGNQNYGSMPYNYRQPSMQYGGQYPGMMRFLR